MPRTPKPAPPPTPSPRPPRRSQAERSDAMRERLLKATLASLEEDGYAGTSVSKVVSRAGVSRGAHLHHYPSKDALLAAAAEQLVQEAYKQLGKALLGAVNADDRLQGLVDNLWNDLIAKSTNTVYLELRVASRHDPRLASTLRDLTQTTMRTFNTAAKHYFQSRSALTDEVDDFLMLSQWLLRGMALDAALLKHPDDIKPYLALWSKMLGQHVAAREGVGGPPPRPQDWDRNTRPEDAAAENAASKATSKKART